MTKDDIIKLAKEAGYEDLPTVRLAYQGFDIERFANLVAAYVMAQPCCGNFSTCQQFCMPKGAAVERETIAQMFDAVPELVPFARRGDGGCIMCGFSTSHAATAIRTRGNTRKPPQASGQRPLAHLQVRQTGLGQGMLAGQCQQRDGV